ncbi:MAG: hypothetical protein OEX19_00580 [Gammaproteobacteria bacterium]|nr:hypothetical protein [Gammaproteobacteria bacterium]
MKGIKFKPAFLLFFFISGLFSPAMAVDINSIVLNSCEKVEGIIIDADNKFLRLLSLNGEVVNIPIKEIDTVFTFGSNKNPFTQFQLDNDSYKYLKEIYFEVDQKEPDVIGWAFKFIEDLVFFYSIDGKMHVLSIDQIRKVRPYKGLRNTVLLDKQKYQLEVSDYLANCEFTSSQDPDEQSLQAVRIISDQIKIGEFLDNYLKGTQRLDNFEERTYLYAKPFLYRERNRLSINYFRQDFGIPNYLPVAFIWSNGTEYHFQSNSGIGAQLSENLPYVGPLFLIRSDFKSHFFSGSFEGNIESLSAGSNVSFDGEDKSSVDIHTDATDVLRPRMVESFNYLAVMGADFGPFSLGVGSYFPVHRIRFDQSNHRDLLAYKMSPLVRMIYTKKWITMRVLVSQSKYKYEANTLSDQISEYSSIYNPDDLSGDFGIDFTEQPQEETLMPAIGDFDFIKRFVRISGDIDVYEGVKLVGGGVFTYGHYNELSYGIKNKLEFNNIMLSAGIEHQFSHYVNLKLFYQVLRRSNTGTIYGKSIENIHYIKTVGGSFELLF